MQGPQRPANQMPLETFEGQARCIVKDASAAETTGKTHTGILKMLSMSEQVLSI